MRFAAGSRLGPYEIISALGAGGMGEVYLGRDPRLGRDVAIKVLPAERMADESRRRRFVQEARSASAINHPNIVTIYEIESADDVDFIVMEFVPGQTLDGLIPKGGMKPADALRIAVPIADAVTAAHARGIVHRDLKPANVIVSREGVVKVLDFGLAKLVTGEEHDGSDTATVSSPNASRAGAITGTAAYMSPEQATGRKADARSDVFAFGAVLYEMLTGRRAFVGRSVSETLTAVVSHEPTAPRAVVPMPEALERLVMRCLRKEPERRVQHMADVKVELAEITGELAFPSARPSATRRNFFAVLAAVALLVAGWLARPRAAPSLPPHVVQLTALPGNESEAMISPDGRQVAFAWGGDKGGPDNIYVKMIGSSELLPLTSDPFDGFPSWSPDGRQIAYCHVSSDGVGTLRIVSPLGGPSRKVSDLPITYRPSWSPDGRWLAVTHQNALLQAKPEDRSIYLLPVDGGEPRRLTLAPADGLHRTPAFSPDGRHLAYASCLRAEFPPCDIHVIDLDTSLRPTGEPHRLTRQNVAIHSIAWTADGRTLVYHAEVDAYLHSVWRVPLDASRDPERLEIAGTGAMYPSIAGERLVYAHDEFDVDVVRFMPDGSRPVFVGSSYLDASPEFSPDGRRIAFDSLRSSERMEIWIAAADGRNPVQLTHGPGRHQGSPTGSPDGRRIAFDSRGEDGHWHVWTIDVDGGAPRRLTDGNGNENVPRWSRDGRVISFYGERGGKRSIGRVPADGGAIEYGAEDLGGAIESPDGRTQYMRMRPRGRAALVARSLVGGPDRTVADCVQGSRGFAVIAGALYYAGCSETADKPLHRVDLVTGQDRVLGKLTALYNALAVSPDGATIVYTSVVRSGSDLMMIENFR